MSGLDGSSQLEFRVPAQAALAADARSLVEAGVDHEVVLGVLRKGGLSKIDSIKVLSSVTGLPLLEAKNFVHASRAWQDTFLRDKPFQDLLAEAVRALKDEKAL